jgi:hypothetical protein
MGDDVSGVRVPAIATAVPADAGAAAPRRGAHFMFAHFPTAAARPAVDWREASREIARSLGIDHIPPTAGDAGVVGWRLITENNRELARSFGLFRNEVDARRDAARMRSCAAQFELHVVVTAQLRGAGWCASLDESPLVVGARRYENRSAARGAAELATRLLASAARDTASSPRPTP